MKLSSAGVLLVVMLAGCATKDVEATTESSATTTSSIAAPVVQVAPLPTTPPSPPKPSTLIDFVKSLELGDADEMVHPSVITIATWAKREGKMSVEELKAFRLAGRSTTVQLARRDADLVRGHTLCANGPVVQIHGLNRDGVRLYGGVITDSASRQVVTFTTAEDVGDTIEGSVRAFCGVFVGRHSYKTLGGGSEIAASIVGMFMLPEKAGEKTMATDAPPAKAAPKPAPKPSAPAANCNPPYKVENGQRVLKLECM